MKARQMLSYIVMGDATLPMGRADLAAAVAEQQLTGSPLPSPDQEARLKTVLGPMDIGRSERDPLIEPQPDLFGIAPASNSHPSNEIERQITETWQRLLGIPSVRVQDNFFKLGGNSILVVLFLAWVFETYQIEIPASTFFRAPTVAAVAALLASISDGSAACPSDRIERVSQDLVSMFSAQVSDLTETQIEEMIRKLSATC